MSVSFFNNSLLITNLVGPYCDAPTLSCLKGVNKACSKAAETDLLWEELYGQNFESLASKRSWRAHFLLENNWLNGFYFEAPIRVFEKNSKTLFQSEFFRFEPRMITPTPEGVRIHLLESQREIFIKALDFETHPQFLNYVVISPLYALIKTNQEIQVYSISSGDLLKKIPILDPAMNNPTMCVHEHLLASVDEKGKVLRVWDLSKDQLLWEEKFQNEVITIHFLFSKVKTLYWAHMKQRLPFKMEMFFLEIERKEIKKIEDLRMLLLPPNANEARKSKFDSRVKKFYDKVGQYTPPTQEDILKIAKLSSLINPDVNLFFQHPNLVEHQFYLSSLEAKGANYSHKLNPQEGFCIIRVWNFGKRKPYFLKKIPDRHVEKFLFSDSKLFIFTRNLKGEAAPVYKMEMLTYDFNPKAKVVKHPEHINEANFIPLPLAHPNPLRLRPVQTIWARIKAFAFHVFQVIKNQIIKFKNSCINLANHIYRIPRTLLRRG